MPGRIAETAAAKINLFLHAGARRADGYHDLQSLAVFASVGDQLSFGEADALSLSLAGPFAPALASEADNITLKAARALAARKGGSVGARIELVKYLPVASGLGGGSADAAATLRGLNELWGLDLPAGELRALGAAIGSDVPACIASVSAWMEGRGERVTPVSLPLLHLVLVNPGVAVSTADVFGKLSQRSGTDLDRPSTFADTEALLEFLAATSNDLEAPAIALAPAINEALVALAAGGALLSRMSGSGATCFGLFESEVRAKFAAKAISETRPDWWARACRGQ
jgi:4-diphosphocytidyl-2-C-methyl-D-erythritol kinase